MAIAESTPAMKAVVSLPISQADNSEKRANPFASAKDVAISAASLDQSPFAAADTQESALAVRTSMQQKPVKKVSFSKKLFSCACVRPEVSGDAIEVSCDVSNTQSLATSSHTSSLSDAPHRKKGVQYDNSPKKSLMKQSSCAYTDVDW